MQWSEGYSKIGGLRTRLWRGIPAILAETVVRRALMIGKSAQLNSANNFDTATMIVPIVVQMALAAG